MSWSEWLEFNQEELEKVPKTPGVFKMHAAMKMMHIGSSENIQEKLKELLVAPCTQDAKRFCYMETESHEKIKNEALDDFKQRYDGKLPKCME